MAPARTLDDSNWPRASAWLAGETLAAPLGTLALVGLPVRAGSISPGRCDLAPAAIRTVLARLSCYDVDADVDVRGGAAPTRSSCWAATTGSRARPRGRASIRAAGSRPTSACSPSMVTSTCATRVAA